MNVNDDSAVAHFESDKVNLETGAKRRSVIARSFLLGGIVFVVLAIWHPSNYTPGTLPNCSEQNWTCTGGTAGTGSVLDVLAEIALFALLALSFLTTALVVWLSALGKRKRALAIEHQLRILSQNETN
jgi:uncharacterized membrane protein YdcZ (DUF606 family)